MVLVDVYSGFLGAGKTTLIRKMLRDVYAGEKVVLLENEFGEVGIDGAFMKDSKIQITEMNSGCICCSLAGDLGDALYQLVHDYSPDRILVEPSGVGKLSDVIRAIENNRETCDLEVSCVCTVVDAQKCRVYLKNFAEFYENQIKNAGTIVLSRSQNLSPEKLKAVVELIRAQNPQATIITTPWEELDGGVIFDAMKHKPLLDLFEDEKYEHHHDHDDDDDEHEHEHHHHDHDDDDDDEHEHEHEHEHHHGHEHHHHHHDHDGHDADEVFTSIGFETANRYTEEGLREALAQLSSMEYGMVLRAKGILQAEDGGWIHFDYVPGEADLRRGSADYTGRLCVIGSALDEAGLSELFGIR